MKGKEMVALASAGFLATLTAGFLMGNVAGRNPGGGSVTRTERERRRKWKALRRP